MCGVCSVCPLAFGIWLKTLENNELAIGIMYNIL